MSNWKHESLWAKARLYADRANEEERSDPLFPLWSTLALEFIARAFLAKINPALLADAKTDENIVSACGYDIQTQFVPKSINANAVFKRCTLILKDFKKNEFEIAMELIERRNAELHSGKSGFEGYGTEKWLSNYLRICKLLLIGQGKTLEDLLGKEEALAAEKMITAAEEKVMGQVKKAISEAINYFKGLDLLTQESLRNTAEVYAKTNRNKYVICPACSCRAIIRGERISAKKPKVDDDTGVLYRNVLMLPISFECLSCKLTLKGHGAVHAADLGGNYEVLEEIDPAEYFGIEQPNENDMIAYAESYMKDLALDAQAEYYEDYG